MFIGRETEIKEIRESLSESNYQGTFIYGRRRIGKSELISHGLEGCKHRILSFEFRKRSLRGNLDLFLPVIKEFFGEPYLYFETFDPLFDYLLRKSTTEEYVLVLDEFSFLLNEDFAIESSLAAAIDTYKSKSKIHLFVSGSYVGLMEKMIDKQSHSYGRFNHIFLLRPFDYFEASQFYPNYAPEEKIMLYSVFGGVPYFSSLINPKKTAQENIEHLMVRLDSLCEREIMETVLAETTKAPLLNELLLIVLKGNHKYSTIQSEFGSHGNGRPDYLLEKLIDMDFLEKKSPINDEGNKKKMNYEIKDNLVDFYYRYLFAAKESSLRKDPKFYYENFIQEDFVKNYIPHKFESISREFLVRMNLKGKIKPPFFLIGSYSYDDPVARINRQFDVVTQDKNGFIAYECKYSDSKVGEGVLKEESRQTASSPEFGFYRLGFISKSGFDQGFDQTAYNCFTLEDFYVE